MMSLEWWADYLSRGVRNVGFTECSFGCKESNSSYWSRLFYSQATGWHQVLYWCKNPQSEISIVKIVYYPSALEALTDNSIFPTGLLVQFF